MTWWNVRHLGGGGGGGAPLIDPSMKIKEGIRFLFWADDEMMTRSSPSLSLLSHTVWMLRLQRLPPLPLFRIGRNGQDEKSELYIARYFDVGAKADCWQRLQPSQRKKRTHKPEAVDPTKKGDPKTFVFKRGKHGVRMPGLMGAAAVILHD